jgi:hypothetical protein
MDVVFHNMLITGKAVQRGQEVLNKWLTGSISDSATVIHSNLKTVFQVFPLSFVRYTFF